METKRECLKYIEGQNSDDDSIAGIIVSAFADRLIVGVTEQHGGDSEVSLDLEKAKELIHILNTAISKIEKHKEKNCKDEV